MVSMESCAQNYTPFVSEGATVRVPLACRRPSSEATAVPLLSAKSQENRSFLLLYGLNHWGILVLSSPKFHSQVDVCCCSLPNSIKCLFRHTLLLDECPQLRVGQQRLSKNSSNTCSFSTRVDLLSSVSWLLLPNCVIYSFFSEDVF